MLIATLQSYSANVIPTNICPHFDDLWMRLRVKEVHIVITCVLPHPGSHSQTKRIQKDLRNRYDTSKFFVLGDFNFPEVSWSVEDNLMIPRNISTPSAEILINSLFYLELQQNNHIENENGRLLDLLFSDDFNNLSVFCSEIPLITQVIHHPPLEMVFDIRHEPILRNKTSVSVFQFSMADFVGLNECYGRADWSFLDLVSDVDTLTGTFYELVFKGIDIYVPKKIVLSEKYPRWFNHDLRKLIAHKNTLYKRFKKSGLDSDYSAFSDVRKEVKFLTDMCYLTFISNTEHLIPENIKHFWSYVKNLRRDSGIPTRMKLGDRIFDGSANIAGAFASFFQSCYKEYSDIDLRQIGDVPFSDLLVYHTFSEDEIKNKMKTLDPKKGAGPDGISPVLLKNCDSLALPLSRLFQKSFDAGYFPTTWKFSNLIPIFKSGDRSVISNYRGVCILSVIPKLFESIITEEVYNTYRSYMTPHQHGFCKGRSTATNLGVYHNFLVKAVESGKQVDAIYTDLSKAFDSVCHPLLLKKLSDIGINGNYLRWIKSYLSDRRQRVLVGGELSREVVVSSGVPQGSHIGPVLFLLFINDVVSCFTHSDTLLYADDLKFYSIVDSGINSLQGELDGFSNWCQVNCLTLNIQKCKVIRFTKSSSPIQRDYFIGDSKLELVTTINDLGVIFDSSLTFNAHIEQMVLKAFRMLGFIKRHTKHICDTKAISCLYNCLVRSILEYCSVVWSPFYQCYIGAIERVQNKFVKYLLLKHRFPYQDLSYETRLLLCGLDSLEHRRRFAMVILLHRIVNGSLDCVTLTESILFHVPPRHTRQQRLFFEAPHRTNYGLNAFTDRMLRNYNRYFSYIDIFNLSLYSLRRQLKSR